MSLPARMKLWIWLSLCSLILFSCRAPRPRPVPAELDSTVLPVELELLLGIGWELIRENRKTQITTQENKENNMYIYLLFWLVLLFRIYPVFVSSNSVRLAWHVCSQNAGFRKL